MTAILAEISVSELKGVGAALEQKLHNLGINNLQDLLFHLPLRYQDRTRVVPIGSLRPGDECVIEGEVRVADISKGRRRSLVCRIQDGTGTLTLRFFHFSAAQKNNLKPGVKIRCFGEARTGPSGLEIVHPEYSKLDTDVITPVEETLTPVYPTTEGLHQGRLRSLTEQALSFLKRGVIQELIPETLRQEWKFPGLDEAVAYLHRPPVDADQYLLQEGLHPAQRRLAFEELLAHHLSLLKLRQKAREKGAPELTGEGDLKQLFLDQLPFPLTGAQQQK